MRSLQTIIDIDDVILPDSNDHFNKIALGKSMDMMYGVIWEKNSCAFDSLMTALLWIYNSLGMFQFI